MQRLKLTNDTIFRKIKMRSLKVYNLQMQKIQPKTRVFM